MERFVVGTGRCGSTLLSSMLAEHPALCSVFELFTGLDWGRRFAPGEVSGAAFAALVGAEQPVVNAVLRRGYEVAEVAYPFGPEVRYRRPGDPVPWLLISCLPRLSAHPDRLFDELLAAVGARPAAPLAAHYRWLLGWLAERARRPLWVERSGSSVDYLGQLAALFPEARFVHLHRDGPETALSMRAHHAYRLPISLLYDAPLGDGTRPSELGPLDLAAPPRPDDPVTRILASRPPPAIFGRYWSDQIVRGTDAAAALPPDRVRALRFETLLARPETELAGLAAHLQLPEDAGWIARAAARIRVRPSLRLPSLDPAERRALLEACRPGSERLGRA